MPTHEEMEAAKAHKKEVDDAQENILEAMFDDLRNEYQVPFTEQDATVRKKSE